MASTAIFDDLELWLAGYLRDALPRHGWALSNVFVSNRDPDRSVTKPYWVAVRYDGGPSTSMITEDASVGVRVGGPAGEANRYLIGELARLVKAIVVASPAAAVGNPVAVVRSVNGPYPVEPTVLYTTFVLGVTGRAFN